VQAHANDLRAEVENDWLTLVAAKHKPTDADLDRFVHRAADNWRECGCLPAVAALLEYAEKITRTPSELAESDVQRLRQYGWSDAAIHDAVQIVAYFNYINRVADALGVAPEDFIPPWGGGRA
jgi:uncharacterized peroxidase-related enzyme